MTCTTCPFALTEESERVQNYGCLPTPSEILRIKRDHGLNWHCHGDLDEKKMCAGFVEAARELGLDPKQGEMASYSNWYNTGNPRKS